MELARNSATWAADNTETAKQLADDTVASHCATFVNTRIYPGGSFSIKAADFSPDFGKTRFAAQVLVNTNSKNDPKRAELARNLVVFETYAKTGGLLPLSRGNCIYRLENKKLVFVSACGFTQGNILCNYPAIFPVE